MRSKAATSPIRTVAIIRPLRCQWPPVSRMSFTGCHRINWPEIERVAKLAGVFDLPADDSAEERKESSNA